MQVTTTEEKISFLNSSEFAYARYKRHHEEWAKKEWGEGYYNIYKKDNNSPTGVSSVFSLSIQEWETLSSLTNKKHQYLVTEKW